MNCNQSRRLEAEKIRLEFIKSKKITLIPKIVPSVRPDLGEIRQQPSQSPGTTL